MERPQEPRPAPAAAAAPRRDGVICTTMYYPTGDPATSAVKLEKCVPSEVRMNAPFTYDITVTNNSNNELTGVVVTDQPENGLRITGSDPRGQGAGSGLHTWALGTLAPKGSQRIRVNATAPTEGTVGSCATVTYASSLCATIPVVSPKLRLTKTGPSSVLACDDIVYQFEVTNTGTGSLPDVKITDALPNGLASADGGRNLTFNAGTLNAGQSKRFTGRAKASRPGRYENRAAAAGGGLNVQSGTVVTVVRQPVLTISKSCPGTQYIGKSVNYEMQISNTGDGEAREVVVTDTLANGLEFMSASDGGRFANGVVTWNLGTLAPRATKTVTLRAMPSGADTYVNNVSARGYCAKAVTDSCSTKVTGIPAILLEVVDIEDPVRVGEVETYVITITNQGSAPDTNIAIVCTLESYQAYESSSGPTTAAVRGNIVTFTPLGTLGPKEKATYRVKAKSVRAGDVRFKVSMNSDMLTRPVEETESTHLYE
ncbi:MAG: DUF11 domain-containing protein [Planctomycetes bacterium]|nr:DUF11 domain-containing protein [Planctomycetota bacterium]